MSAPAVATIAKQSKESQATSYALFLAPGKRTFTMALVLIAAVVFAYSPIAHNDFLNFDDGTYIANNPHIKAGLTAETVKWAFTTFEGAHYHPLTWLSHAVDCQLFGLDPAAHHEVNVLLHATNAVLLFLLLLNATGFPWRSLFVAALFALHPINVESVAWASERKNVLSMLFCLLAMRAYIAYARQPKLTRYALVALLFAMGLLSKSQIVTLPFLLLLLDYWPLNRFGKTSGDGPPASKASAAEAHAETLAAGIHLPDGTSYEVAYIASDGGAPPRVSPGWLGWLILEKLPLLALSAAIAAITVKSQRAGGAVIPIAQASPLLRLETALISYVHYVGKLLWPTNLALVYPQPSVLFPAWKVAGAILLLAAVTGAVLYERKRRYLTVGWFWFLGALIPMVGLVRVGAQAMPDHFAYLPFLGLFLMLTWSIADWASANPTNDRSVKAHRLPSRWLAVPAVAVLLALGVLAYRQLGYWRNSESIWTHTLELTENNSVAHDMLGFYLSDEGRPDEALAHFRTAVAILPGDLSGNLGLGAYDQARGNLQSAITHYQVVAAHAAQPILRADAYGNMGSVYRRLGDLAKAKECFETASKLAPDRPMPIVGLGLVAQGSGDFDEAIRQYSRAMAIQPTDVGYLLIASALDQKGRRSEARAIRERVARFSPDFAAAQKEAQSLLRN
jgi:tetratricopeptide (TPR) repeat protein